MHQRAADVHRIFLLALELAGDARARCLDTECGGDASLRKSSEGCIRNDGNCVYRSFKVRGTSNVLGSGGRAMGDAIPTREMRVHEPPARTRASPVPVRSKAMSSGTPVMSVRCSCSVCGRYSNTPPGTPSHSASSTGSPATTVICRSTSPSSRVSGGSQ